MSNESKVDFVVPQSQYFSKPFVKRTRKNPLLDTRGHEVLDPVPLTVPLRLTSTERLQRIEAVSSRLSYDNFLDDDDFHEHLDDIPDQGLSPYEIDGFKKPSKASRASSSNSGTSSSKDASLSSGEASKESSADSQKSKEDSATSKK